MVLPPVSFILHADGASSSFLNFGANVVDMEGALGRRIEVGSSMLFR